MKKILANLIAPILVFGLILACDDEDITNSFDTLDIAPVVDAVTPDGPMKIGEGFDITVKVSDGAQSPLQSVSITLKDSTGTELGSTTIPVSGTADSVAWAAADNGSAALTLADYTITVVATDIVNLSTTFDQAFSIFDLPFNANQAEMYVAGNFNGWQPADNTDAVVSAWKEKGEMTLVADHIWKIEGALLDGNEWKFKNTVDWTDVDWGADTNCTGDVVVTTGGGDNINCGFEGEANITFNDEDLTYTVELVTPLAQNVDELFLMGSFNSFGDTDEFVLDSNNTWVLAEVILKGGDQFFFVEGSSLDGSSTWGDNEPDDVADKGGTIITLSSDLAEAFYKVSFNDMTLAYQLDFVKLPSISIIGSARTGDDGGWSGDTFLRDFGNNSFRHAMGFYAGAFKFRQNESWDNQWGGVDFPGGTMVASGGGDIIVDAANADTYIVILDPTTGAVTFTATEIAIIGAATGDDTWSTDINMTQSSTDVAVWSITLELVAGDFKIRTDESWDYNWGPDGYNTAPNYNVSEAGNYTVEININTGATTIDKN